MAVRERHDGLAPHTLIADNTVAGIAHTQQELGGPTQVGHGRRTGFTAMHDRRPIDVSFPHGHREHDAAALRGGVGQNADRGGKRLARAGKTHLQSSRRVAVNAMGELPVGDRQALSRHLIAEHGVVTAQDGHRRLAWLLRDVALAHATHLGREMLRDPGIAEGHVSGHRSGRHCLRRKTRREGRQNDQPANCAAY